MRPQRRGVIYLLSLGMATRVGAQAPRTQVEVSANTHHVSGNLGDWHGAAVRVRTATSPRSVWYLEGAWQQAFRDEGTWMSAMWQHDIGSRWTTWAALGGGSGSYYFPDLRADVSVSRAMLSSRRVVLSLGSTYVDAKRGYSDAGAWASARVHAGPGLIYEIGTRANRSSPGRVTTGRGFTTVTVGREGGDVGVLRASAGREGYQLLDGSTLREFASRELAASWRHWFTTQAGVLLGGEGYWNDAYSRRGGSVGFFIRW